MRIEIVKLSSSHRDDNPLKYKSWNSLSPAPITISPTCSLKIRVYYKPTSPHRLSLTFFGNRNLLLKFKIHQFKIKIMFIFIRLLLLPMKILLWVLTHQKLHQKWIYFKFYVFQFRPTHHHSFQEWI